MPKGITDISVGDEVPVVTSQATRPDLPIIGGDALSASIAAASVVAKVERDRLMSAYDREYPHYGFGRHKG